MKWQVDVRTDRQTCTQKQNKINQKIDSQTGVCKRFACLEKFSVSMSFHLSMHKAYLVEIQYD